MGIFQSMLDLVDASEDEEKTLKQLLRPRVLDDGTLEVHPAIDGSYSVHFSKEEFVELAEAFGFECKTTE